MNKLKFTAAALALSTLLGGHAFADASVPATVTMGGPVEPTCTLDPLTQVGATNAALAPGATSSTATVNITTLASASTALYQTGTVINLGMSGMCNYAHSVSLQTTRGGLKPTPAQIAANPMIAGSLPFITHINYNAIATWGGPIPMVLSTSDVALDKTSAAIPGFFKGTGNLSLSLISPSGFATRPLIAGDWSDTVTVQIGAAL